MRTMADLNREQKAAAKMRDPRIEMHMTAYQPRAHVSVTLV